MLRDGTSAGGMVRFFMILGVAALAQVIANAERPVGKVSEPEVDHRSEPESLKVMAWNIWRGGREDGEDVGPKRVIDVIRDSGVDIVAMQETYGSGELISKGLKFHFQERGTNLSIHSRHPIIEDISVSVPFQCIGGLIDLPGEHRVAFYSIWLPYAEDIWLPGVRASSSVEAMQAACKPSVDALTAIRDGIEARLADPKYEGVEVIIAGDFNSMSHLDYTDASRDQFGYVIPWQTSQLMTDSGYRDVYREHFPQVDRRRDSTWTPRFPEQEQDRIDFVYLKSTDWIVRSAAVLRDHSVKFPSDHAAVVVEFTIP